MLQPSFFSTLTPLAAPCLASLARDAKDVGGAKSRLGGGGAEESEVFETTGAERTAGAEKDKGARAAEVSKVSETTGAEVSEVPEVSETTGAEVPETAEDSEKVGGGDKGSKTGASNDFMTSFNFLSFSSPVFPYTLGSTTAFFFS